MTKATGIKYSLKHTTLRYANEWRLYHLVHFVKYGRNILLLGLTENERFTVMCSRSRQNLGSFTSLFWRARERMDKTRAARAARLLFLF